LSSARRLRTLALVIACAGAAILSPATPTSAQPRDCARFIADVTVPIGTQIMPGQTIEKVWRLANCGQTTWDGYRAVRVSGEYGPESFEVPRTPPGTEVDLMVRMQVPTAIGQYSSSYQLIDGGSPFGFFGVSVDVADCSPPEVLSPMPGAALDPGTLPVPSAELGGRWCLVDREGDGAWSAVRYNSAEYASPRRAQFWVSVWPDVERAEQAMLGLPKGFVLHPFLRQEESGPWEIGDGSGRRLVWINLAPGFTEVDYIFRVDRTIAWVRVRGGPGQETDLDALARRLALAQLERIGAVLAVTPLAPPATQPGGEEVYAALLATPFDPGGLLEGFAAPHIRSVESYQVARGGVRGARLREVVGIVEVSVREPGAFGRGEITLEGVYFLVFRTAAEAQEQYSASGGFDFIFFPRAIAQRAYCTFLIGKLGCLALDGNVLVVGAGNDLVLDALDVGRGYASVSSDRDRVTDRLDPLVLAKAGIAHLEAVRTGLARQPRAPARAPVQLPSR
jgi:hypothetical protein